MWVDNDLTEAAAALRSLGDPAGYTWDVDHSQHVVYRDTASHIQELFYQFSTGVWVDNDLTEAAGGAPLAVGNLAGYTWDVDHSQHVVYRDTASHIQELFYQPSTGVWVDNDLTEAAGGAPLADGDPTGYTWDADHSQHVVYHGMDNHIHELFFQASTGVWAQNGLTSAVSAVA